MPLGRRLPFWFLHFLAKFIWSTGRCLPLSPGSGDYETSNKIRKIPLQNVLVLGFASCALPVHCVSSTSLWSTHGLICQKPHTLTRALDVSHVNEWKGVHGVQIRGAWPIVTCALRRGVVKTWSSAFCLCRTFLPSNYRPHILPSGPGTEHRCH